MNILFVNLTRFGDLLQSQAALSETAGRQHGVGLVCLENFVDVTRLMPGLTYVAPLPGAFILSMLAQAEECDQASALWSQSLARLITWRNELETAFAFDAVCNLTPSIAARVLSRFIAKNKPVCGFGLDDEGFGYTSSPWAAFLQGASSSRGASPYNIVDIFRKVVASLDMAENYADTVSFSRNASSSLYAPSEASRSVIRLHLETETPAEAKGWIGLQLGASEWRRQWPVSAFAALGQMVWDTLQLCPVLLGTQAEASLAAEYTRLARHPHIVLTGKTDIIHLAAVLLEMKMLVTNDTGTMHLAAGLQVPVTGIFLATAQVFDTGPYLADSLSVEPAVSCHPCAFGAQCQYEYQCHNAISAEALFALLSSALQQTVYEKHAYPTVRVWKHTFDAHGCMIPVSISGHENEDRSLWLQVQRDGVWQFLSLGMTDRGYSVAPVVLSVDAGKQIHAELHAVTGQLEVLQQQANLLLVKHVTGLREKFMGTWNRILSLLQQSVWLRSLAVLWVETTQAKGQRLDEVIQTAAQFHALLVAYKNAVEMKSD